MKIDDGHFFRANPRYSSKSRVFCFRVTIPATTRNINNRDVYSNECKISDAFKWIYDRLIRMRHLVCIKLRTHLKYSQDFNRFENKYGLLLPKEII